MSATQRTNWFWSDWLGDQAVRRLTPAERGVWIDLLALAAGANPVGYVCDDRGRPLTLDEIARVTNAGTVDEVAKLIAGILDKGVASRDRSGRLYNRRMVRDAENAAKKAALSAERAQAGAYGARTTSLKYFGKQTLPRQVPQQRPPSSLRSTKNGNEEPPNGPQVSGSACACCRRHGASNPRTPSPCPKRLRDRGRPRRCRHDHDARLPAGSG